MADRLCILVCANFRDDVAAAIAAERWTDVSALAFPARCGRPPLSWDELRACLPPDATHVAVLGRACLKGLADPPPGFPAVRLLPHEQCFHLLAPAALVDEAVRDGAYLVSPGWLADWRGRLAEMGFANADAAGIFADFARELVLLDTLHTPEAGTWLAECAAAVGLPERRLAIGLDHLRLRLGRVVLEWRLDGERAERADRERRHGSERADLVTAMDFLAQLAQAQDEASAIAFIEQLFRMLFAPEEFHYLRVENGVNIPDATLPPELEDPLRQLHGGYAWTPDGAGFMMTIGRPDGIVGRLVVHRLAYPDQRERYVNLALAVSGVCGLAIENARNRRKLVEAEKMASLGIVVAGVAHEINTPLGVSLAASSSLRAQARTLAGRFADRSMTRSDLETFLGRADEATSLIRSNLERIGQLVDAFRQVAVGRAREPARRFALRRCLDDVVHALGSELGPDRAEVEIDIDSALEIDGTPGDWASIFTNLIGNSLKHGLRGRESGVIHIRIHAEADVQRLAIEYEDNGVGMSADVLARMFDPFFTTDLQHGMGLGMHLVYNLVTHRMGGEIRCDSRPGEGVHFRIVVPR